MGLADDLLEPTMAACPARCRVAEVLDLLAVTDPPARDALITAIGMPKAQMPGTVIARRLKAANPPIECGDRSIQRHRAGDCKCPR